MSVGSFMLRSAASVVNCLHFTAYLMPFKIYTIATHIEDFSPSYYPENVVEPG